MKAGDILKLEEAVMDRIFTKLRDGHETANLSLIKEAIELGLSERIDGRVYEGKHQEEFNSFAMVCEAVTELDAKDAKKAAESLEGTGVQLFDMPNGKKGVAIRSKGKYTFIGGDDDPVTMSESEWNIMEKELTALGAKSVTRSAKPSAWISFLKNEMKTAVALVKIVIVIALVILAFKALLPITAGLFTGFAQYTPWGNKLLSAEGLELFKKTVKAEVQGKWLVAQARQKIMGGSMAGNVLKTFY